MSRVASIRIDIYDKPTEDGQIFRIFGCNDMLDTFDGSEAMSFIQAQMIHIITETWESLKEGDSSET